MHFSNRIEKLLRTSSLGIVIAGLVPLVFAQTTTSTAPVAATKPAIQTPAQRAAAAQLAAKQADERAAAAQRQANVAAAKANTATARAAKTSSAAAATTSPVGSAAAVAPQTSASSPQTSSRSRWFQQQAVAPANTAPAATAAAAPTTPTATSTTTAPATQTPAKSNWFQQQAAAPASTPQAAAPGKAGNSFTSGYGSMTYSDLTAVSYGCLRQGTRVFCDYDQFKRNIGQANANWNAVMVLSGGRTVNQQRATYIDTDGTPFPTAQLSPATGVRMMVEYDDVPLTQSKVDLVFGQQRVNVPIVDMPENGPPPRSATSNSQGTAGQQFGTTAPNAQTSTSSGVQTKVSQAQGTATNAAQSGSSTINGAAQGVKSVGDTFKGIFKKTPPQ